MPVKFTRRALAGFAATASVALAQPVPQASEPPLPSNLEEELTAVRAQHRANADQIAKINLSMSTEPAVHFKA